MMNNCYHSMSVSQLSNGSNRIQPSVLTERVRNDFHCLRECLETVGVCPGEGVGVKHELPRDFCLWCSTASNQEAFLHETTNDAKCVMERSKSEIMC